MAENNVSRTQSEIRPVLTGWLMSTLLAESCFLLRGGKAQVEACAKEEAKQKVFTELRHRGSTGKQRLKCSECWGVSLNIKMHSLHRDEVFVRGRPTNRR